MRLPRAGADAGAERMLFPDRESREMCWKSRDAFFKCMDENPGKSMRLEEIEEDKDFPCVEPFEKFKMNCAKSWVEYFIKKREWDAIIEKQKTSRL